MLTQWELWVSVVVFGLGLLVAIGMAIATALRGARNTERFLKNPPVTAGGVYQTVDMQPVSVYSKDYNTAREAIVQYHVITETEQNLTNGSERKPESGAPSGKIAYVIEDPRFVRYWIGLYAPAVSMIAPIIVAFNLLVLYLATNFDLGYFTRSDAVVANYFPWVIVAVNYTAFIVSFLFITGGFKTGVRLVQLFAVGALTFIIGAALALGTICTADTQWIGLGAGLFLHIIVGLILLFLIRDEFMVDCGLHVSNACTWIKVGLLITWIYISLKVLFLILGVEYTAAMSAADTTIAQVLVDNFFYVGLTIIGYIAAVRIEDYKTERLLRMHGLQPEQTALPPPPPQPIMQQVAARFANAGNRAFDSYGGYAAPRYNYYAHSNMPYNYYYNGGGRAQHGSY